MHIIKELFGLPKVSYNHAHFSRSVLKNNRDNSMRREFLKQTSLPNPSKTKKKSK